MLHNDNHCPGCVFPVLANQVYALEHDQLHQDDQPHLHPLPRSLHARSNNSLIQTKINKTDLLVTIISFSGIILMIKPEFIFGQSSTANVPIIYVIMSLASAFLISIIAIRIRKIKDEITNNMVVQYFYFSQIYSNAITLFSFELESKSVLPWETKCTVLFGFLIVSGYLHQILTTRSLYFISASKSMPFRYVAVIIGFLVDILYYSLSFDWISISGIVVTSLALAYMTFDRPGSV